MALSETAHLAAELNLKGDFSSQLTGARKALGQFDAKLTDTQGRAYKAGQQIGTGIKNGLKIAAVGVGLLFTQVAAGLNNLVKLEKATAQTNAVIKSTGGAAGVSAIQVRKLAEAYESVNATIDDKLIQSSENLLLTFTNITGKAFKPALEAILDMNTAMGGGEEGLRTTVIQVGKALNDPAKGFTALRRVGVAFTKDQEKRIKALQKEGKLYEAQQIILGELGKEFGGSFAAGGKTAEGTIAGIGDAVEDLQNALATALFPVLKRVLPQIQAFLANPAFIKGAEDLGASIAGLFSEQNIAEGSRLLGDVFRIAQEAAPVISAAAGQVAGFVGTAVGIFKQLPPEIQALAVAGLALNKLTGGLVTNIAGGLISAVISSFKGLMNVNAAVVNVNGAVGGVPGVGGAAAGAAAGTGLALTTAIAAPIAVAAVALIKKGEIDAQAAALQQKALQFAGSATDAQLAKSIEGVRKQFEGQQFNTFGSKQATGDVLNALIREQNRRRGGGGESGRMDHLLSDRISAASRDAGRHGNRQEALLRSINTSVVTGLRQLSLDEAKILGGLDPRKDHGFIVPQRTFIQRNTNRDAIKIADAFTTKFGASQRPFYRSTKNAENALQALRGLQQRFIARGDTKSAAKIGRDIATMKRVIASDVKGVTRAVKSKDLSVSIKQTTTTNIVVNGRKLTSANERYTSSLGDPRTAHKAG